MGFIVATSACHRKSYRKASASSSCTPHPLLIVETLGWHVPHHNSQQSTDIHAGFHSRGNAEQVNGIYTVNLWRKAHALKQLLPLDGVFVVSLASEFLTVEPEGRSVWRGQEGVVILFQADFTVEKLLFKASRRTVGALSERFVQVSRLALGTYPYWIIVASRVEPQIFRASKVVSNCGYPRKTGHLVTSIS
jgi:hypothetical protein